MVFMNHLKINSQLFKKEAVESGQYHSPDVLFRVGTEYFDVWNVQRLNLETFDDDAGFLLRKRGHTHYLAGMGQ